MKQKDITDFLRELTGRQVKYKITNGWVSTACPLAPWTHVKGDDDHPSFGVKIQANTSHVSIFNCYTCKKKGPLSRLATYYQDFSGKDCTHLIDDAQDIETFGIQLPLWEDLETPETHLVRPEPLGAEYEDIFDEAVRCRDEDGSWIQHPYLRQRKIHLSTTRALELKYDPADSQGDARIVFPVRGLHGQLFGYTGRAVHDAVNPRIRDYYGLPKRACLLGLEHFAGQAEAWPNKVILCEGLFDYVRLWQNSAPAVAAMHSGLTELQAQLLRDLGKPVVLMYDNDEAGRLGAKQATKLLQGYVPLEKVQYPHPDLKDPGMLRPDDVERMLKNSRLV